MRRLISNFIASAKANREATQFQRAWSRALSEATTESHRAEINAVFSRNSF